ncbi:MAG: HAD family hydrolase [Candidatus Aminicenantes bacterium]|nr:HAD family hydrolase [Candidatus Aminicenantes bacterium]
MKRAVFLDRDGTLIQDRGYICEFSQVAFFPFAAAAVRLLNRAGYLVVVASNQSAVARGICSAEQVERLHRRLQAHFSERGAAIAAFYYCPFLAGGRVAAYRRQSPLRKPEPGMLLQAARELDLDLAHSFMVGDKADDVEAGRRAGCGTVLVRTGEGESASDGPTPPADFVVADLAAAARLIASLGRRRRAR